jgi:polygalacturonase
VIDSTPGDVLIAGLNDDHRTEVTLDGVQIDGITPAQVHGRFATVTLGPLGTNLNFSATDIKVVPAKAGPASTSSDTAAKEPAFTCDGKFVPMQ